VSFKKSCWVVLVNKSYLVLSQKFLFFGSQDTTVHDSYLMMALTGEKERGCFANAAEAPDTQA
jgi:hypothetical protein